MTGRLSDRTEMKKVIQMAMVGERRCCPERNRNDKCEREGEGRREKQKT